MKKDLPIYIRVFGHPNFEWMDGMRTKGGDLLLERDILFEDTPSIDMEDPATKGCLLHLNRKAYQDDHLYVEYDKYDDTWHVWSRGRTAVSGKTEGEALVKSILSSVAIL